MKLKRLFLSLRQDERDDICAAIIEAGIGKELGTLKFKEFLKTRMLASHGNSREYLKHFRRLDAAQQERFYEAMTTFKETE
jgi:hypothetical protein